LSRSLICFFSFFIRPHTNSFVWARKRERERALQPIRNTDLTRLRTPRADDIDEGKKKVWFQLSREFASISDLGCDKCRPGLFHRRGCSSAAHPVVIMTVKAIRYQTEALFRKKLAQDRKSIVPRTVYWVASSLTPTQNKSQKNPMDHIIHAACALTCALRKPYENLTRIRLISLAITCFHPGWRKCCITAFLRQIFKQHYRVSSHFSNGDRKAIQSITHAAYNGKCNLI